MDRSKIVLASIGGVTLAALAVFGFLGLRTAAEASAAADSRDRAVRSIEKIYRDCDPFPSMGNVAKVRARAERMGLMRTWLTNALASRDVPAPRHSPSVFVQALRKLATAKVANAPVIDGKKIVAPGFTFGFERYIGSDPKMPGEKDVPRLVQQLLVIDGVVDALFEAKVSRIDAIVREQFDAEAGDEAEAGQSRGRRGGRRGGAGRQPARAKAGGSGWRSQHFTVKFDARQDAAVAFINGLAKMKYFVLVTDVAFVKPGADVRVPGVTGDRAGGSARKPRGGRSRAAAAAADAEAPAAPTVSQLPPARRIMSGREIDPPIAVTVEFDVYAFAKGVE